MRFAKMGSLPKLHLQIALQWPQIKLQTYGIIVLKHRVTEKQDLLS